MRPEAELFRAFLAWLPAAQRQQAVRYWWWASRPWPWDNIHPLAWGAADAEHEHLQRAYADWLLAEGDPRGQAVSLLEQLARARSARSVASPLPPAQAAEAAFRTEIARNPRDPAPWLVCADWLEENGDPRAAEVRVLGQLRPLEPVLGPDWLETLGMPVPPRLPSYWAGHIAAPVRTVLQRANQEAIRSNHEYLGTHHLLLGLALEAGLLPPGASHAQLREVVDRLTPTGSEQVTMSRLPRSSCLWQALAFAFEEAGGGPLLAHHLLLGLCRARPSAAVRSLEQAGLPTRLVCTHVLGQLRIPAEPWLRARPEAW